MTKQISAIFILLLLSACGRPEKKIPNEPDSLTFTKKVNEKLRHGILHQNILCSGDDRFSYCVYIPNNSDTAKEFPLVLFFDAHAKGCLPVEKYKQLADQYGFVVAGSNDSKNGMAGLLYPDIKKAIVEDLKQKVQIDSKRIYLSGFSGGARVALNLGLPDPSIAGIIANSAGFEPSAIRLQQNQCIIGLAGNEDFNLMEQVKTENMLASYQVPHFLLEFNGGHEWAPADAMQNAFLFLEVNAKKSGMKRIDTAMIQKNIQADLIKLKSEKNKFNQFILTKRFLAFYTGIVDVSVQQNNFNKLKTQPEIINAIAKAEKANATEAVTQNSYYMRVFTESPAWWEKERKKMLNAPKGSEELQLNKRLLSYTSLAVYMTINSPEAQKDVLQLEKFIAIYEIVDPENPEWAYLKALLRAKQNNIAEAKTLLIKSFSLGFSDKQRLQAQHEFANLLSDPEIQQNLQQ